MTKNEKRLDSDDLAQRKQDHIELTMKSQTAAHIVDTRFDYEPLFFRHPDLTDCWKVSFLGFDFDLPLWISSMTGGASHGKKINQNLARLCDEFNLGMGLGSCRALLSGDDRWDDFAVRKFLGNRPFFANLGVAQIQELIDNGKIHLIHNLVSRLEANGLIIHINPLQEWFQPEGDRYRVSPLQTLQKFLENHKYPVLVKEVGQGLGPQSLKALLELPIAGIEFGAFGGTNFSLLESLRGSIRPQRESFINVGHSAHQMVEILNNLQTNQKEFIISGGIKNVLDGYALQMQLKAPSVIGMAQAFLTPAQESYEVLQQYFLNLRESLLTAKGVLRLKGEQ
jgi:isopentenyl-diphosphate Delta-isomerase